MVALGVRRGFQGSRGGLWRPFPGAGAVSRVLARDGALLGYSRNEQPVAFVARCSAPQTSQPWDFSRLSPSMKAGSGGAT